MLVVWLMAFTAPVMTAQAVAPTKQSRQHATIAPADMLDRLDRFRTALCGADRQRLDDMLPRSADGGIARCDRVEGSRASCEVVAYRRALRTAGLMRRFRSMTGSRLP